jgi:hypothetical protein
MLLELYGLDTESVVARSVLYTYTPTGSQYHDHSFKEIENSTRVSYTLWLLLAAV